MEKSMTDEAIRMLLQEGKDRVQQRVNESSADRTMPLPYQFEPFLIALVLAITQQTEAIQEQTDILKEQSARLGRFFQWRYHRDEDSR